MSTPSSGVIRVRERLLLFAQRLEQAALTYRVAWRAQAEAAQAWQEAREELQRIATGPHALGALARLAEASKAAQLLQAGVELDAMEDLEQGALQLEAVAQGARKVADALLHDSAGGLQ